MGRLPVLSGAEAVRIFEKAGWKVDRQRGSHVILVKDGHIATLSVPDHKELARGTLRSLIRAAGDHPLSTCAADSRRLAPHGHHE